MERRRVVPGGDGAQRAARKGGTYPPQAGRALALLFVFAALSVFPAEAQQPVWSKAFGGGAAANGVAADLRGDLIMGGAFTGTVDFGAGLLRAAGDTDGIIGKYSSADGHLLWSLQLGGRASATTVMGVATDADGNVYATGAFSVAMTIAGTPLTSVGGADVFVTKVDGMLGSPLWSIRAGGTRQDKGYSVTVDTNDNVVITGYFSGSASFGGPPLTSMGGSDGFLAAFSAVNGAPLWSRSYGGTGFDYGNAVAAGLNGAVALTGSFSGAADFGGGPLTSVGGTDGFLAMYGATGAYLWSRGIGSSGSDIANAVATDSTGALIVTGYVSGAANFGGGTVVGGAAPAIFLAKYGADGGYQWAKTFHSPSLQVFGGTGRALAVDAGGNIALTGSIIDDIDFGGGALGAPYTADIFAAMFGASGGYRWSKRFPAPFRDGGEGIAFDSTGHVAIAGRFAQAVDFGGGVLSPGANNAFLAEFASGAKPVPTPTATHTQAVIPTPTATPTNTSTSTPTRTVTSTPTQTATTAPTSPAMLTPATKTQAVIPTPTATPTNRSTSTPTRTVTSTPTQTATTAPTSPATLTPTPMTCVGDCNRDRVVAINELITGVNIALGNQPTSACPAFENAQGKVDITQLITGVNTALNGCGFG